MADVKQILGPTYDSVSRAPLEIRDADATLLARGTVATLQDELSRGLAAGSYTATVVLAPGDSFVQQLSVDAGGNADVGAIANRIRQAAESSAAARADAGSGTSYAEGTAVNGSVDDLAAMRGDSSSDLEGMGAGSAASPGPVYLRLFRGTGPDAWPLDLDALHLQPRAAPAITRHGSTVSVKNQTDYPLTTQLLRPGQPPLNIIVPVGCRVALHRPSGPARAPIDMLFDVPVIDELIGLRTQGALSEAAGVATTLKVSDVLEIAAYHPNAAVAAAYILLRTGSFEVASATIKRLFRMLPLRTDLLVLRAELHARLAATRKARAGFVAAVHSGIPMASTGLTYLVDRLRFYSQMQLVRQGGSPEKPATPRPASSLKKELLTVQRVALRCDFALIFTNYTGPRPGEPGDTVWNNKQGAESQARLIFDG